MQIKPIACLAINFWSFFKAISEFGSETFCYLTNIAQLFTLAFFILRAKKETDLTNLLSINFSLQLTVTVMYWAAVYPFAGMGVDPLLNFVIHGGLFLLILIEVIANEKPIQVVWVPTIVAAIGYSAFLFYYTTNVKILYVAVDFKDATSFVFVAAAILVGIGAVFIGQGLQSLFKAKSS